MHKKGISLNSVEKFLSHSTEKFRWGTLRCFRKFRVSQNFMHKKGISLNSVEKFLSHSADKIRRRTLLCFERILVSKIFKQRRRKLHGFVKFFYLTGLKKLCQGTILCFRKFLVGENILWIRGGGASRFCRNFLSHRTETKIFVTEPFCFSEKWKKNFWKKNLWIRGGISRFSVEIFMSHSAEKFRKGILLFLRKFVVSKSFIGQKRGYHVFPSKILGLTVPKNFVGIPSMFRKIWGIEKFYA